MDKGADSMVEINYNSTRESLFSSRLNDNFSFHFLMKVKTLSKGDHSCCCTCKQNTGRLAQCTKGIVMKRAITFLLFFQKEKMQTGQKMDAIVHFSPGGYPRYPFWRPQPVTVMCPNHELSIPVEVDLQKEKEKRWNQNIFEAQPLFARQKWMPVHISFSFVSNW